MDDPKNFQKNFFGSNAIRWSNSKSYHNKSEIWRPSIFLPPSTTEWSNSKTVNAIENLIRYAEYMVNFLSDCCQPFFYSILYSGCYFTKKTANFHDLFGWSSVNISTTTWNILMKHGKKWDKVIQIRRKRADVKILSQSWVIQPQLA